MRIINLASCALSTSLLVLSGQSLAQTIPHTTHSDAEQHITTPTVELETVPPQHETHIPVTTSSPPKTSLAHPASVKEVAEPDVHQKQHGGQIYQSTVVESRWLRDEDGQGQLKSELETRIGTDEHKLFVKIHQDKVESQQAEYDAKVLYSRMISTFWDAQAGVRYRHQPHRLDDQDQYDAVVGVHGLAPYFFETDAYLSVGEDQQVALSLETERDLLLTQKLILKPYLDLNLVLSDDSDDAQKNGLSSVEAGIETRYEINKQLMPFIDVGYGYHKGQQQASASEKSWFYGAGLRFKF